MAVYRLENASGTLTDDVGSNDLSGTDLSYQQTGKRNYGVTFNGTSAIASISAASAFEVSAVTVSVWFKTTADKVLVTKGKQVGASYLLWVGSIGIGTAKKLNAGLYNGGWEILSSAADVDDGEWHHAVFTHNGTHGCLYVDNVLAESDMSALEYTNPLAFAFGAYIIPSAPPENFFAGTMDEVTVWDTAISASAVAALWNSGTGRFYTP